MINKLQLFYLIFFTITSCSLFETETISKKQIIEQSKWSISDQYPSFPECEDLENEDQKDCFDSTVNYLIQDYINTFELESDKSIDIKFNLTIEISKDGVFKLIDFENENLGSQIPNFNNIIKEAVDSLPKALPAVKTNVGVYVATKFTLPIELKTLD